MRGGSWNNNPRNLRSANRNRNEPDNRNDNIGFRLSSTLPSCRSRAVQGRRGRARKRPGAVMTGSNPA
ncbi:SUMF1/EgtB/PvdO family nonheme iron enzyme [Methylocapsa sp. S129]|uniref:SUMF1/EgtB/PvdO family nonheme iron enzyme n=1 Tax=Methylocapsa sp. S129 TaxID=1641869 RepID=UPI00352B6B6F